ncbi:MAG: indolepyruvate oxidoreductase subunit beta [Olegusella sp.]|nr:indolepyruvate oxidoreductase subunit beta [Olegusella sp.]
MTSSLIICGVGGQGSVLAGKLISDAAMACGMEVKTAETIGMAQRGGSVFTHVRLGEGVECPLIGRGRADAVIGFEPAEVTRHLAHLRQGGTVVTSITPVVPVSAMTGGPAYHVDEVLAYLRAAVPNLIEVDAVRAEHELGSAKCLNVVLLGAAARAGVLGIDEEDLLGAIRRVVPARFQELNTHALAYGASLAGQ